VQVSDSSSRILAGLLEARTWSAIDDEPPLADRNGLGGPVA
jgi:hypothetical protein